MTQNASTSLCMIVRNEAHQLDACLAPVASLFADIVIVDTGSVDNTQEIARRYTTRVFNFPWCDDFSAARNSALSHALGNWIFWLDADDRLSQDNIAKLRKLLAGLSEVPQAFIIQSIVRQGLEDRDRERATSHLRLFRRHPDLKWQRRIHEQLTPWPADLGYEIVVTDIQIEHLGYIDRTLLQQKLHRNLRLLEIERRAAPGDPALHVELAHTFSKLGESTQARHHLNVVLSQDQCPPRFRHAAFTAFGELATAEGRYAESQQLLQAALHEFPGDDYLLYMHAEALSSLGRYAEAKAALIQLLTQPAAPDQLQFGVPSDLRQRLARVALGGVLRLTYELREAERVLREVTDDFPHDPTPWYFLGRVYLDGRNWPQLSETLLRLNACPNGNIFALLLKAESEFVSGQLLAAEQTLDSLIALAPQMIQPRALRLECLARRHAPSIEQLQACRDVLRLQPLNACALDLIQRLQELA